jgi:hypothetical protein
MTEYIPKSSLVAEIERRRKLVSDPILSGNDLMIGERNALFNLLSFIDTLEVIDPYKQYIQYASIEAGIKAHAEDYSFNIESELFQQLTEEQQALWRKEIEEACISGGYAGYQLAKDPRYKENHEVKEMGLNPTLEDISIIRQIMFDYNRQVRNEMTIPNDKEYCQEVLKRFKQRKER